MNHDAAPMAAHTAESREAPRTSWIVWLGLGVVLLAAAALSFEALTDLALAVGIRPELAWLVPVVVDAGAAVSTGVWLGRGSARDAARFAGRLTVGLLVVTVVGNAAALGIHAYGLTPPWWAASIVGAIPPAVVWSVVHLVVQLTRAQVLEPTAEEEVRSDVSVDIPTQPTEDELLPKVREWLAETESPSARKLRAAFGIGAERAKALMEAA